MKKKTMRIVSMLACLMVIATSGVACGGRREDGTNGDESLNKPVDVNKTQFAIANANGGWGAQWLRKIADNFEEFYKDTIFEDGKVGVQVSIDNKAVGEVMGNSALSKMQGSRDAIFLPRVQIILNMQTLAKY